MNNKLTIIIAILAVFFSLLLGSIVLLIYAPTKSYKSVPLVKLASQINEGKVDKIIVKDTQLEIYLRNGEVEKSNTEKDKDLKESLKSFGAATEKLSAINIKNKKPTVGQYLFEFVLPLAVPFLIAIAVFVWLSNIIRRALKK